MRTNGPVFHLFFLFKTLKLKRSFGSAFFCYYISMIVVGFDSGLEKTGYSVFKGKGRDFKYIHSDLIFTEKTLPLEKRLEKIYKTTSQIVKKYHPDLFVIEKLFYFKNQKTFISVAQAQGVVLLAASENNIRVKFLTPLQIKQTITGYGRADKKAIQKMLKMTLNLDAEIKIDDVADAVSCAVAYFYLEG